MSLKINNDNCDVIVKFSFFPFRYFPQCFNSHIGIRCRLLKGSVNENLWHLVDWIRFKKFSDLLSLQFVPKSISCQHNGFERFFQRNHFYFWFPINIGPSKCFQNRLVIMITRKILRIIKFRMLKSQITQRSCWLESTFDITRSFIVSFADNNIIFIWEQSFKSFSFFSVIGIQLSVKLNIFHGISLLENNETQ